VLLVVGLGNPGPEHVWNRHNIGFMVADGIAHRYDFERYRSRFSGLISRGEIEDERVSLFKPTNFMNESGRAVNEVIRFFKLSLDQVVVVHDDLDLTPGKVRIKTGGGAAGHNGLRSIDSYIGKDYRRIRIGIGHPGERAVVSNYVLSDFVKDDQLWLDRVIPAVTDAIPFILRGDGAGFTNKVSLLINPPSEQPSPDASAAPTDQE
ncbi:uncharacterized protein METZ01_LOCUS446194, partial [marine metagenome]